MTGRLVDLVETYQRKTRDPATVALAVVPLVLVYGLGLLHASGHARSGVDLVSDQLLARFPTVTYVGIQLGIAVLLVVFALFRRQEAVGAHVRWAAPSVAEACLWGLGLGAIVLFIMDEATLLGPIVVPGELVDRLVLSAGAGLHEELVFRLVLIPVLALAFERLVGLSRAAAIVGAAIVSSLCFAGAHHLAGEPFDGFVFAFRTIAGGVFAALFLWRGFAVSAWAHAAYDFHALRF
ncbi:MAG: CPBP family intramembrane metalloprotease [Deltaproteobacteria bacterium]|nr:CPBP family intramembrane metalloprotease [Deltaproteobacteria bacterium]